MKYIPLTQGKFALVDDSDFNFLNQWKWCFHRGYAKRANLEKEGSRHIHMHRVILPPPLGLEIDHINRNGLDNRRSNLRAVTHKENMANTGIRVRKKQPGKLYKGTNYDTGKKRWRSQIYKNGFGTLRIGYFKSELHAAIAFDLWAKDYLGDKAILNFPN